MSTLNRKQKTELKRDTARQIAHNLQAIDEEKTDGTPGNWSAQRVYRYLKSWGLKWSETQLQWI